VYFPRRILTNGRSAKLTAMFSPASPLLRDAKGRVCIERSGERFGTVLSFLSTGTCPELPASGDELVKLLDEADFYQARCYGSIHEGAAVFHTQSCLAFCTKHRFSAAEVAESSHISSHMRGADVHAILVMWPVCLLMMAPR